MTLPLLLALAALQPPPAAAAPPPPPRANLGSYFTFSDYPRESLRNGEEGRVFFRLTINPEGRVRDCTVTRSSGWPRLDETTCRLLTERLRYRPARDAAGNPTSGTDEGSITWQLP
jgi:periplasmic protein TonB